MYSKAKKIYKQKVITGAEAVAEAMRQINPEVVAAYPITPQTHIVEKYSEYVANGLVDSEFVPVESEHSALSCVIGAQAAGARSMTATSSQGLAYMWEVLGVTAGMRLPIVMSVANRALSAPINIHCDHSDSMGAADQGWIQIFSEDGQEAYENTLLALKLAEHENVLLPVMVMQDGFVTSHSAERIKIFDDKIVKAFIGEYIPHQPLLNFSEPVTYGAIVLPDNQFEMKRQQIEAMKHAKKQYINVGKELSKITGSSYGYFEEYKISDAKAVIIVSSSTAGTVKNVVDKLRRSGKKVGILKIKLFRPFPYEELAKSLKNVDNIGVLDRAPGHGSRAPIFSEAAISFSNKSSKPNIQSCIFGLGGRDIEEDDIEKLFLELLEGKIDEETKYLGLEE